METVNAPSGIQWAATIFTSLIGDRLTERYRAVELLNDPSCAVHLPTLRTLLLKAIDEDFSVGKEEEQEEPAIGQTRSWLLGTLARISAGDEEATELVIKHVTPDFEPYDWARYWSLEGLISGGNPEAEVIARRVANNEADPMVAMLATAFLGSKNERGAAQKIKQSLQDVEKQWFALRALRIVPLPATVAAICKMVEEAAYTDETYDAIMALGKIPNKWSHSTLAAHALSTCVVKMRGAAWKDGMRTGAITGLGNLGVESSAPLLIEELADDNPAVVREAARSIVMILGLRVTVIRVVEAAARGDRGSIDAYGRALRWLNREAVAEELETLMISGAARQQEVARTLLSELGGVVAFEKLRARTDAMKQYTDLLAETEQKIRQLFEGSVREAQSGFHLAVIMDVVVFAVGIVLLLGSAGYALFASGDLEKWAGVGISGGAGVLGIVYSVLVANPRRQVRESVDHLMRMKIMFLAYLRRLNQMDQAYTRRLLDDEPMTVDEVRGFADVVGDIMDETLRHQLSGDSHGAQTVVGRHPRGDREAVPQTQLEGTADPPS